MTEPQSFRRGDIVLARFPLVTDPSQVKVRPAVVIQNNRGNRYSANVIVAAISSQLPSRPYPTNLVLRHGSPEAAGTGLDRDSVVQAENIFTIPKEFVVGRLGRFNEGAMRATNRCVTASLGLS